MTEGGDNFDEDGDGEEVDWRGWAWNNMNNTVEQNKEGPWYMREEHIMDEMERRPDHPDYDPTTLHIPKAEWNSLTAGMVRYWEIKSKNFDKIVFYRYGHWFIVYFKDADICNRHIDLCIPPRQRQSIVGFHESSL